jgi:hypothetical protein
MQPGGSISGMVHPVKDFHRRRSHRKFHGKLSVAPGLAMTHLLRIDSRVLGLRNESWGSFWISGAPLGQIDFGPPLSELRWMQHFNPSVAGEVIHVERENVFDPVNYHGRNQPGVVGLLSANPVCSNEAAPFRIDGIRIWEPENRRFDAGQHSLGLAWGKAKPVVLDRSRADRPELDEVLRCHTKAIPVLADLGYSFASLTMLWICAVKPAKENVGIGQDVHYRFQSSSRV